MDELLRIVVLGLEWFALRLEDSPLHVAWPLFFVLVFQAFLFVVHGLQWFSRGMFLPIACDYPRTTSKGRGPLQEPDIRRVAPLSSPSPQLAPAHRQPSRRSGPSSMDDHRTRRLQGASRLLRPGQPPRQIPLDRPAVLPRLCPQTLPGQAAGTRADPRLPSPMGRASATASSMAVRHP